jgi:2'-5' RNA ligase
MRLFLALELPPEVQEALVDRIEALRPRLPGSRWVRRDQLHLTLVFLGETEETLLPRLAERLAPVFERYSPLTLRVEGGGTFPPRRPARVAWAGVVSPPELSDLQGEVARAASAAVGGELEGRPFHAHVTLARCRRPWPRRVVERFAEGVDGPFGPPFTVREGTLFESRLDPGGARYMKLAAFPLAEGV